MEQRRQDIPTLTKEINHSVFYFLTLALWLSDETGTSSSLEADTALYKGCRKRIHSTRCHKHTHTHFKIDFTTVEMFGFIFRLIWLKLQTGFSCNYNNCNMWAGLIAHINIPATVIQGENKLSLS